MTMSIITIHMSSIEMRYALETQSTTTIGKIKEILKIHFQRAPLTITTILFKAGTFAIAFSTLKYGGLVFVALWMLPAIIALIKALCGKTEGFRVVWLASLNVLTTIDTLPDKQDRDEEWFKGVRINHHAGFVFNSFALIIFYLLAAYTNLTFH